MFLTKILLIFVFTSASFTAQFNLPDSVSITQSDYKRLYQIRLLQLNQQITQQWQENPALLTAIELLKNEAEELAERRQYEFALLILDEIDDLIYVNSITLAGSPVLQTEFKTSQTEWEPKVIFGFDSWQQKFELNYGESDTVLSENSMNPFAGVQINLNYERNQTLSLTTNTLIKKSRDYFAATQHFRMNQALPRASELQLSNYLDWTHFTHSDYVSSFQNKFSAGISCKLKPSLLLNISDDFRYKQYASQEYYYASFFQNEIRFAFDANFSLQQRTGLGFRLQQRRYHDFSEKDFNKLLFNFSGDFSLPLNASLRFFNDFSRKEYLTQNVDTLFQSNYLENWLVTSLRIPLTTLLSLEFNDNFTFRKYENEISYLRDNHENEIEGYLQFHFTPNFTIRAGYFYGLNLHRETNDSEDVSAQVEDYYSHGPAFSLDYYLNQQLLLNITNSSRNRIYPNSQEIENLSLYSDRNLKSLFIFLAWEINPFWQLNLLTNYDADQDLENENSNSRSSIFSLEISHRF